jgi:hypothetical protein
MDKRYISTIVLAVVAGVFVVTNAALLMQSPSGAAEDVASGLSRAITNVANSGIDAKASREGRHLGFDTYAYPGDRVMNAWRARNVPYEWVGYYLPSPCHDGTTWAGKRQRLADMGWGMAVIYVGQQTWDKIPTGYEIQYRDVRRRRYVSKRVKVITELGGKQIEQWVTKKVPEMRTVKVPVRVRVNLAQAKIEDCNAQLVSPHRGALEALDAVQRAETEGFPRGSVIFLDIEHMRKVPQKMRDYYKAWTAVMLVDGRYRPGVYAHAENAAMIYKDVKAVYLEARRTDEPAFWVTGGGGFSTEKRPHEVGYSFAAMWQGVLNVIEEWNGHALPIDVNVAAMPNPSAQPATPLFLTTADSAANVP